MQFCAIIHVMTRKRNDKNDLNNSYHEYGIYKFYCDKEAIKEHSRLQRAVGTILRRLVGGRNEVYEEVMFKDFVDNGINIRYDFFIPKYNLVIEVHGMQHFVNTKTFFINQNNFIEQIKRDKFKKELAKRYGLVYGVVTFKDNIGDIDFWNKFFYKLVGTIIYDDSKKQ